MSYQKVNWLNKGETGAKYINKTNLNQMDNGIYNLDLNKVEVIQLLTVGDTAPVECERGDKYYDTTDELIYTATTTDTWGTEGETPLSTRLYVDLSSSKLYYYDGTNFDSYGGGGGGDSLPVGTIFPFSGNTLPSGYMICDGSAISRTTYSTLFGIIGTTYGVGDGSTTFNLPNLKGKVPVGYDSTDSDFDTLGETGGEKTHALTVNEMPSHNHALYGALTGETKNITNTGNDWAQTTTSFSTDTYINNAGGGQAHNNLQPYIVINYIIKVSQTTSTQAQVVDGYSTSTSDSYSCNYVNNLVNSNEGYIELGNTLIIYGILSMNFQPGENSQTINFLKNFLNNNYTLTLTFQKQESYYTHLSPVVYNKSISNVQIGAFNSYTTSIQEDLGYIIIGKKSTD